MIFPFVGAVLAGAAYIGHKAIEESDAGSSRESADVSHASQGHQEDQSNKMGKPLRTDET